MLCAPQPGDHRTVSSCHHPVRAVALPEAGWTFSGIFPVRSGVSWQTSGVSPVLADPLGDSSATQTPPSHLAAGQASWVRVLGCLPLAFSQLPSAQLSDGVPFLLAPRRILSLRCSGCVSQGVCRVFISHKDTGAHRLIKTHRNTYTHTGTHMQRHGARPRVAAGLHRPIAQCFQGQSHRHTYPHIRGARQPTQESTWES